jgi:biopolymer transport protein ExbD
MRKFGKIDDEAEINMTPMLDIVFIMLIFFIVTATFIKESGLDMNKPDSTSEEPQDDENRSILITVDNNNVIRINLRRVDIRQVRANIQRLYAENPEATVVIQPSPRTYTGVVVEIYDQALAADVQAVAVVDPKG